MFIRLTLLQLETETLERKLIVQILSLIGVSGKQNIAQCHRLKKRTHIILKLKAYWKRYERNLKIKKEYLERIAFTESEVGVLLWIEVKEVR